jgi:hypothetical protein
VRRRWASDSRAGKAAKSLAWFSIGLGVAEIVAPRKLSRLVGVKERPLLMRMLGAREILSGIGILAQHDPTPGLWSRVVGDGIDLGLLGWALTSNNSKKSRLLAATVAATGVTAVDLVTARRVEREPRFARSAITINRPQVDVYEFLRDTEHLSQFIKSVSVPFELVAARPNEFVEWRSQDGKVVRSMSVSVAPAIGRNGTEVSVVVDGNIPRRFLHEDVRRLKWLLETGEIPTTAGQPVGPSATAIVIPLIQRLERKGAS